MIGQGQNTSWGCLDDRTAAHLEGMGRLGAFRGCDDCLDLDSVGDGSVSNDRMSPVGVQIEIGAIPVHAQIQHLLLSMVLSLNVESGSTLFSYYVIRVLAPK